MSIINCIVRVIGQSLVPDQSITNSKLADNSVTAEKIVDKSVNFEKLSDNIISDIENKVDKETGKGLSENDYTDNEKTLVHNAVQSVEGKGLSDNNYSDEDVSKLNTALQPSDKTEIEEWVENKNYLVDGDKIISEAKLTDELSVKINSKANTSDLSEVAFSGSYNDLSNKPRTFKAEENFPENPELNDICVLYKYTDVPTCNDLFVKDDIDSGNISFYKPNFSTTIKGNVSIPEFTVTEQKGIQILDGLTGTSDYIMVFLLPASEEINKSVINVSLFQYDSVHQTYREAKEYYYAQNGTMFVGEILSQGWYEMVDDELTPIEEETIEDLSMCYALDVYETEEGEHQFAQLTDNDKNLLNTFIKSIKLNGIYVNTINGWRGIGYYR